MDSAKFILVFFISTHAPRVRRDTASLALHDDTLISTHAPRVRRDAVVETASVCHGDFYSRASCEARPPCGRGFLCIKNFYSRASCEARRNPEAMAVDWTISTHAPRVRRDRNIM